MEPGAVAAPTRRACVMLTVAGSLLLISGLILILVNRLLGAAVPLFAVWTLLAAGLSCGASLIVASAPYAPHARPGQPQLAAGDTGQATATPGGSADLAQLGTDGPPAAFGQANPAEGESGGGWPGEPRA